MFVKSIGVEHDNALNLLLTLIAEKHIEVDLSVLIEESDFIEIISLTQQIKGVENGGFN
jgi:antitoxin component of RelBE/YafQ-DinJ toxin-antitoxin module